MAGETAAEPVLKVRDLRIHYETPTGDVLAVDGVSFDLHRGEALGFVGESGCGKSTAAMGILQLVPRPGRVVGGEVWLEGEDLLALPEDELRKRRWSKLSLVPQGAMNSLNPTMTVGAQIRDVVRTHLGREGRAGFKERLERLLGMVGLPAKSARLYPHELSGGMKQRACIAMAVALGPSVVIADEATSALDVVVQRLVAQTMREVQDRLGVAMIMIGHDMGLMAQMADRVAVMYAGHIVEIAPVATLFAAPAHPYTRLLIESVPTLTSRRPLRETGGLTHDPRDPPSGCIFRLRCPYADATCAKSRPERVPWGNGGEVACHHAGALPAFGKPDKAG